MKPITCNNCNNSFEPQMVHGEIQCPKCGMLQELTEGEFESLSWPDEVRPVFPTRDRDVPAGLGSLSERTEFVEVEVPETEKKPSIPMEDEAPEEADFHDRATQMLPYADIKTKLEPPKSKVNAAWFGPTLVATSLFLGWVYYDKQYRPQPAVLTPESLLAEDELLRSVQALRANDRNAAVNHINEALHLNPNYALAKELQGWIQSQPSDQ